MKTMLGLASFSFAGMLVALSIGAASRPAGGGQGYVVTVTNLTPGQIFSPILVAAHDESTSLFRPGAAASSELALLAEEGDNSALLAALSGQAGVADAQSGPGVVMPGTSQSVLINTAPGTRRDQPGRNARVHE